MQSLSFNASERWNPSFFLKLASIHCRISCFTQSVPLFYSCFGYWNILKVFFWRGKNTCILSFFISKKGCNSFFFFLIYYSILYAWVFCRHVCLCTLFLASTCRNPKRVSDSWGIELQMVVCATWVLKSNLLDPLPSHLSSAPSTPQF